MRRGERPRMCSTDRGTSSGSSGWLPPYVVVDVGDGNSGGRQKSVRMMCPATVRDKPSFRQICSCVFEGDSNDSLRRPFDCAPVQTARNSVVPSLEGEEPGSGGGRRFVVNARSDTTLYEVVEGRLDSMLAAPPRQEEQKGPRPSHFSLVRPASQKKPAPIFRKIWTRTHAAAYEGLRMCVIEYPKGISERKGGPLISSCASKHVGKNRYAKSSGIMLLEADLQGSEAAHLVMEPKNIYPVTDTIYRPDRELVLVKASRQAVAFDLVTQVQTISWTDRIVKTFQLGGGFRPVGGGMATGSPDSLTPNLVFFGTATSVMCSDLRCPELPLMMGFPLSGSSAVLSSMCCCAQYIAAFNSGNTTVTDLRKLGSSPSSVWPRHQRIHSDSNRWDNGKIVRLPSSPNSFLSNAVGRRQGSRYDGTGLTAWRASDGKVLRQARGSSRGICSLHRDDEGDVEGSVIAEQERLGFMISFELLLRNVHVRGPSAWELKTFSSLVRF